MIPKTALGILHFIGSHEAPEGYGQVYGGSRLKPPKPLEEMTIGEVLAWQDASVAAGSKSSAAGRYQIIRKTLRSQLAKGVVSEGDLFDGPTQDKLGFALMQGRGYDRFERGEISETAFGNALAKEWASLPMLTGDKAGKSAYDGDGLNSALTDPETVLALLKKNTNGGRRSLSDPRRPSTGEVAPAFRSALPQSDMPAPPNSFLGDIWAEFADSGIVRAAGSAFGSALDALDPFSDALPDDPTFDFTQARGYAGNEQHWRTLSHARNQQQFDDALRSVHREQFRRKSIETGGRIVAPMIGGLLQPETLASMALIPGGATGALGVLKVGAKTLAYETGAEVLRQNYNPTATLGEGALRVAASTLFATGMAGGIALMGRKAAAQATADFEREILDLSGYAKPTGKMDHPARGPVVFDFEDAAPASRGPVMFEFGEDAAEAGPVRVVTGQDLTKVSVEMNQIAEEYRQMTWRTYGLDDEMFPTVNHWAEFRARLAVEEHADTLPFGGHGFDLPDEILVLGKPVKVLQGKTGGAAAKLDHRKGTLEIDGDRLVAAFERKAWTAPHQLPDGSRATPLPEGAFATLEDWISFVVAHELQHLRIKRAANETLGIYEDRINAAALADGQRYTRPAGATGGGGKGGKPPIPPSGGGQPPEPPLDRALASYREWHEGNQRAVKNRIAKVLDRMVDTPYKRVHRAARSGQTRNLMDILALDGGLRTMAMAAGQTPGASIENLAKLWEALTHRLKDAEDAAYEKYLGYSGNPRVTDVPVRKSIDMLRRRRASGERSIGVETFRRRAAIAHMTGVADEIAEVNELAAAVKKFYGAFEADAREVGVLGNLTPAAMTRQVADLDALAKQLEAQRAARVDAALGKRPSGKKLGTDWDMKRGKWLSDNARDPELRLMDEIEGAISRMKAGLERELEAPSLGKGAEEDYFSRVWLGETLRKYPKTAKAHFERLYRDMGLSAQDAEAEAIDLLDEISQGAPLVTGRSRDTIPTAMRKRGLNVPNARLVNVKMHPDEGIEVIDLIETDILAVASNYQQRMGPYIELGRRFNGEHGIQNPHLGFRMALLDTLRRERKAFGDKAGFADHWAPIERDMLAMKDRVMHATMMEPWRWDNRAASVLKDWATLVFMGKAAISTLPDTAKMQMAHGVDELARFAMMELDDTMRPTIEALRGEARAASALTDVALGGLMKRFAEVGTDPEFLSRPEKFLRGLTNRYFIANGLGPITYTMRSYSGAISAHEFMAGAVALAKGEADDATRGFLAQYGIDGAMAAKIAKMADDGHASFNTQHRVWYANSDEWTDAAARRAYRAAIRQRTDNTILVASAADKPTVIDGVMHFRRGNKTLDRMAGRFGWIQQGDYWRVQSGMASLPFQFWNYSMAAQQKLVIAGLEDPNARFLGGLATMVGLGYMALSLRTPDWSMNQMSPLDKIVRTIDQSGMTGVMSEYAFMFQNGFSGITGVNPMPFNYRWGHAPNAHDAALDFLGPGPSVLNNAVAGVGGLALGDPSAMRTLGWALPFRNHVLLSDTINSGLTAAQRQMR